MQLQITIKCLLCIGVLYFICEIVKVGGPSVSDTSCQVSIHKTFLVLDKKDKIMVFTRRGGSNEYLQSMFLSINKKNNVYH